MVETGRQQWLVCLLFSPGRPCTVRFHVITAAKKRPGCACLSVSARLWGLRFSGLHLCPERTVVVPHARSTLFLVCGTWRHCSNSGVTLSHISHPICRVPLSCHRRPTSIDPECRIKSSFSSSIFLEKPASSPDLVIMCGSQIT